MPESLTQAAKEITRAVRNTDILQKPPEQQQAMLHRVKEALERNYPKAGENRAVPGR